MWLLAENMEQLPRFTVLIQRDISRVPWESEKTWNAMLRCAGIFGWSEKAKQASAFMLPWVGPEIVPSLEAHLDFNRVAEFRFAEPSKIYFSWQVLARFETTKSTGGRARSMRFMHASILHEMVHFLDFWADKEPQDGKRENGKWVRDLTKDDVGFRFEKIVFGEEVKAGLPWD